MDSQFINNKVLLLAIDYSASSGEIFYLFLADGIERKLIGRLHGETEIRGLEYSDELDDFVMSLMPFNEKISKTLFSLSWAYADGANVEFPVVLV